ncbi:MAG: hemerythrin domain-containing protein [Armatimonadota bacterium]
MHKKLLVILVALLALSLLAGCPRETTPTGMEENGTRTYTGTATQEPDLLGQLRDEHEAVRDMLVDLETTRDQDDAAGKLRDLREGLIPHMRAEESVFYPAVATTAGQQMIRTATEEHRAAGQMLTQLQGMMVTDPAWAQRVVALRQAIETHVAREEGQIFPMAAQAMTTQQWDQLEEQFERSKDVTLDTMRQGGTMGTPARTTTGDMMTPDTTGRTTTNGMPRRDTGTATPTTPGY